MQICIYKSMIKIYCILSFFNFVFHQRRDRQEAFFGGILPQKAEPQHCSQWAFRSECSSEPSLTVFPLSWWCVNILWQASKYCLLAHCWSESGLVNFDFHFLDRLSYSMSRVQGLGRSDWYISDISSMFVFSRVTIMLGTRPSNRTAVFWVGPNLKI